MSKTNNELATVYLYPMSKKPNDLACVLYYYNGQLNYTYVSGESAWFTGSFCREDIADIESGKLTFLGWLPQKSGPGDATLVELNIGKARERELLRKLGPIAQANVIADSNKRKIRVTE